MTATVATLTISIGSGRTSPEAGMMFILAYGSGKTGSIPARITPVIPSKENEDRELRAVEFDKSVYKRRSIVECLIGWLKESRRIATRYEKTAIHFGGMVKLAFIHRYLRLCIS